jgi:ABC-type transport system substrate-binding protein
MTAAWRSRFAGAALAVPVCAALAVLGGCSSGLAGSAPAPSSTTTSTAGPSTSGPASTTGTGSSPAPPFVARVQWIKGSGGRSLHIVPTPAGRAAQGPADDDEAWSEVTVLAADADQPGMRAQFDCHWTFARLVQPDKPSWNIEPWRPVVTESQMVDARCNPGGPESAEG